MPEAAKPGRFAAGIPTAAIDALAADWQADPALRKRLFAEWQGPSAPLPDGLHPAYADTHFQRHERWTDWPAAFAIITGYATTGSCWPAERNAAADRALAAELRQGSPWVRRLIGYSPLTGHAEPGWAVALGYAAACALGQRYRQDALYWVRGDTLWVSRCAAPRRRVLIGAFRPRVHTAPGLPVVRPG